MFPNLCASDDTFTTLAGLHCASAMCTLMSAQLMHDLGPAARQRAWQALKAVLMNMHQIVDE